jgi:hypothetical protein
MNLNLKADEVENISIGDFDRHYFNLQKPVILKGVIDDQPAALKWSMQWFKQTMGDTMVDLYDSKKTSSSKTAITKPDMQMRFGDYLGIISDDKPFDYRIFLFNIFKQNAALKDDLKCPAIFRSFLKEVGFVFFGGVNSVTRMHQDIDMSNVLLTQFDGKKRVVLFSPEYSGLLYKLPFNTFSLVDIEHPDYEKYPGLKYVQGYDIVLERGDTLFMPSGWWHHIEYLTGGFSVSYRKIGPDITTALKGVLNLSLYMPFDKLMTRFFDEKWYNYKRNLAFKRADREMEEISNRQVLPSYSNDQPAIA